MFCKALHVLNGGGIEGHNLTLPGGIDILLTWKEANSRLEENDIGYFTTTKHFSLVVKSFIESYFQTLVYLKPLGKKLEIAGDFIRDFEEWLKNP